MDPFVKPKINKWIIFLNIPYKQTYMEKVKQKTKKSKQKNSMKLVEINQTLEF